MLPFADAAVFEPLDSLTAEVRRAARHLTPHEARYLVDTYYQMQADRIRATNQIRAMSASNEPPVAVTWVAAASQRMENNIKRLLQGYAEGHPVGQWSMSIVGIGPVIAAGLLAHIDISQAPTVSHIWRFAGLDPTAVWEKGRRRPWNASLKVLCWKAGESFVKVSGHPRDYYGRVYRARKAHEEQRNESGAYVEQAAEKLRRFNIGRNTTAYEFYSQGKLPPAHIDARARRYTVKLFLSHWHHVAWESAYGTPPPKPYVFTEQAKAMGLGDHADFIAPPNWPMSQ